MPHPDSSSQLEIASPAVTKRKERLDRIDIYAKVFLAFWAVPAFIVVQTMTSRREDRENSVQVASFESHKRLAEAELARGIVPMLLKEGPERELGLRLLSSVAPEQAAEFVTVLQTAGQPVAPKLAADVRSAGRLRHAEQEFEDARNEARIRRAGIAPVWWTG